MGFATNPDLSSFPMSQAEIVVALPDGTPYTLYKPWPKQLEFHNSSVPNLLAYGNRGGGKLLDVATLIPTPTGYKTMGSVTVGDQVLDEKGSPCNVVWKSDLHLDPDGSYKLTFDDGTEVVCGANHEWLTFDKHARDRLRRRTPEWREQRRLTRKDTSPKTTGRRNRSVPEELGAVRLTKDIVNSLVFKTGNYTESNHAVQVAGSWQFAPQDLLIDPYVLGVWLGDGTKNCSTVTGLDREIFAELEKAGYTVARKDSRHWAVYELINQIRKLGLYNNKSIPEQYLIGSVAQRLALLQGLMDTDGSCELDGKAEFCNTNYNLARGVYRLAASLGLKPAWAEGRAKRYGKDCGPKYRVTWTSSLPVFRLARKLARIKPASQIRRTQQFRFIVKAERIPNVPMQCIQVDSASHLYLCTEVGIPTHNSLMLRMDAHIRAMSVPNINLILVRRTYPELLRSHLIHIKREMKLLGGDYHATDHIANYPNGSKLFFSHVASEADALNLLSAEFLAAYFDELSTIPWDFFVKLCASVRVTKGREKEGLIASVRAATNPLGPSAGDIFNYFVNKDVDPEEDPDYNPADWHSIKIQMDDNPALDVEQYKKKFAGMPDYLKKAWLEGEFALENQLFNLKPNRDNKEYHVISSLPMIGDRGVLEGGFGDSWKQHESVQIYRGFDLGYSPDPAYCVWIAHIGNRYIVFKEKLWYETVASDIAKDMIEESRGMRISATYCDPVMDIKTAADVRTIKDIFEDNGVPMEASVNNREHYAHAVHTALAEEVEPGVPRLQILQRCGPELGCPYLIKTIPQQRYDPKHPLRMADNKNDHGVIALAYFLISSGAMERKGSSMQRLPKWMRPKPVERSFNYN